MDISTRYPHIFIIFLTVIYSNTQFVAILEKLPMPRDLSIGCHCGTFKGNLCCIAKNTVNRVICGCKSCQAYSHYLGRSGMLDEYGGTHVVQTSPKYLQILGGIDQLSCLQLSPKGALRWYTKCCDTPIANTFLSPGIPFLALNYACITGMKDMAVDDILGPVRARVNTKCKDSKASYSALISMLLRYGLMLAHWRLRGDHHHSPFFNRSTGKPIVVPEVLRADQLNAI